MVAVLSITVMALAFSVGAFAGVAHAQYDDNLGYGDVYSPSIDSNIGYGDVYSPADTGWSTSGYQDSYSAPAEDTGWATSAYQDSYTAPAEDTGWQTNAYQDSYSAPDTGWQTTAYQDSYTAPSGCDCYTSNSSAPTSCDCYTSNEATSPTYSPSTPYFSAPCSCYSASPVYASSVLPQAAISAIPTYAMQYLPSSIVQPSVVPQPIQHTPVFSTSAAPTSNTSTNVSPNTNTNTNVNTPTFTATYTPTNTSTNTNTNTPTAVATNGNNTNIAKNGNVVNNFSPVINVGATAPQHIAQAVLPTPSCTIYASNGYVASYGYNAPVTLTWSSSNATSAYISPNVGNVQAQGSTTVVPTGYTTYTMTVYGPGGTATCQAVANYAQAPLPPAPVYTAQPASPYVSLTQIPYTGFDFGPWGNAMYWAILFAFAGAAAYLLVYFSPKLAFAGLRLSQKEETFANSELKEVFKSAVVPATVLEAPKAQETIAVKSVNLPKIETHRITTDSMVVDNSSGTPRLIISRQ